MAITALTVITDRNNYCRYERDRSMVTATVTATGGLAGDPVAVKLQRETAGGFCTLGTQTIVLPGTPTNPVTATFDLTAMVDANGLSLARVSQNEQDYRVLAEAGAVQGSARFSVTPISPEELRERYLFGLSLAAKDVLMPRLQPQVITGVTVASVSADSATGGATLAFVKGAPNTLSWAGGDAIPLNTAVKQYLLPDTGDAYIMVNVDHTALPGVSTNEKLFLQQAEVTDDVLVYESIQAHDELQRRLRFFFEPTVIVTPRILEASGLAWYDVLGAPASFYTPDFYNRWPEVKLPHPLILTIHALNGWINQDKAVEFPLSLIAETKRSGLVQLVPSNELIVQWQLTSVGVALFSANNVSVPNFWQYHITAGLREMPQELQDLVAKKAALDPLIRASVAKTGGATSTSLSRDGVSESRSYQKSPYSALIEQYSKEFEQPPGGKDPLVKLRQRYVGLSFVTL